MFKVNNKNTKTTSMTSFWGFLLITLYKFHTFFCCLYCWLWTSNVCWGILFELRKWNLLAFPRGLKFKKNRTKKPLVFFWFAFFYLLELDLLLLTWSASLLIQWMIQFLLHYFQHWFHHYLFHLVILICLNNIQLTIKVKPKSTQQSKLKRSW